MRECSLGLSKMLSNILCQNALLAKCSFHEEHFLRRAFCQRIWESIFERAKEHSCKIDFCPVFVPNTTVFVPNTTLLVPNTAIFVHNTTVLVQNTTIFVQNTTVSVPNISVFVPIPLYLSKIPLYRSKIPLYLF